MYSHVLSTSASVASNGVRWAHSLAPFLDYYHSSAMWFRKAMASADWLSAVHRSILSAAVERTFRAPQNTITIHHHNHHQELHRYFIIQFSRSKLQNTTNNEPRAVIVPLAAVIYSSRPPRTELTSTAANPREHPRPVPFASRGGLLTPFPRKSL